MAVIRRDPDLILGFLLLLFIASTLVLAIQRGGEPVEDGGIEEGEEEGDDD